MARQPLASSFINVSREHRVFYGKDSIFRSYEHCVELMRDGVLDKDTRNAVGQCFGSVILNFCRAGVPFDFSGPWSALLCQWMALGPYSLFECLNDVTRGMFWEAFLRALLCNTGKFDILVDCLKRFQNENGQGCVPQYVCIKLEEAARWSPLRLAWMQATATHG